MLMAGMGYRLAWRRVVVTAAAVVILAGLAASSAWAKAWLSPVDVSPAGQGASTPHVALDAAGDAVAVWVRSGGTNQIVQAAVRPAGGSFGPSVALAAVGQDSFTPQVALDQAGDAVAVWVRSNGANQIVQAAVRPAGGSFGAPLDLSVAGQSGFAPQVAMDKAGDAIAVWYRFNGTNYIVQAAVRPAGGSFGAPVDLAAAGQDSFASQVALDQAGDAVAVWVRFNGSTQIVQGAVRPAGGSFGAPVDLSAAGQNANAPQVALDEAGDALAVWVRSNGANQIVQAASYESATQSPPGPAPPGATSRGTTKGPPSSLVLIAGRTVLVSKQGFASVPLTCTGPKKCAGTLMLETAKPIRLGRKRKLIVRLGATKFVLPAGRKKKIKVHLSKPTVRLVRRLRRLSATAIVKDRDGVGKARVSRRTIILRAR